MCLESGRRGSGSGGGHGEEGGCPQGRDLPVRKSCMMHSTTITLFHPVCLSEVGGEGAALAEGMVGREEEGGCPLP